MSSSDSAGHFGPGGFRFKWPPAEKALARRAFDRALKQELDELIANTKRMVNQIAEPEDIWKLVEHLMKRRDEINAQNDC